MREPSTTLPPPFHQPSTSLCVPPPYTPVVVEHPTTRWNRAGVPTPRYRPFTESVRAKASAKSTGSRLNRQPPRHFRAAANFLAAELSRR
jgi:hypothetical protein